jgi:hypothetical protein
MATKKAVLMGTSPEDAAKAGWMPFTQYGSFYRLSTDGDMGLEYAPMYNDGSMDEEQAGPLDSFNSAPDEVDYAAVIAVLKGEAEPSVCIAGNPTVEGMSCGDPDCVCARR